MKDTTKGTIEKLDFSGGIDSWFDLWHLHLDWEGEANNNWNKRKIYLDEFFEVYNLLIKKLEAYPNPYQIWIEIHENDSSSDAIYIHTKNPNQDNFPISFSAYKLIDFKNRELENYLKQKEFVIKGVHCVKYDGTDAGNVFFIFNEEIGESFE